MDHKRGDTFNALCTLRDAANQPVDLTGWTIRSQVRNASGGLIDTFDIVTVNAAAGQFRLFKSTTPGWVAGTLYSDIEYTNPDGHVVSTSTFEINCIKDQTV